ncbi:MAG TPA: 4Fe-4S dicluster domain-containing protein [Anaeromyxobacter sp.]|nr:4Fe-4S dicluster domain-containing protein [Anaeromyxobacter sp.]
MRIGRRGFFKIAAIGAGAAGAGTARAASAAPEGSEESPSVLVDTTLCVGCRACEAACSEANQNPAPPEGDAVFQQKRETTQDAFTVVNAIPTVENRYAKRQCMHCLAPACASACPVRAMDKKPEGPVTYDPSNCLGCRYCMIACPFDIPKYEYDSNVPRVRKCQFCAERQAAGLRPACVEVCPSGALTFGHRGDMLELAKTRIYTNPDRYVHHVYGEHEAGGTSWLYIGDFPLEKLALRSGTPDKEVPELVAGALGAPPFVMTLWPPLLMGIYAFSKRRENGEHAAEKKEDHHG